MTHPYYTRFQAKQSRVQAPQEQLPSAQLHTEVDPVRMRHSYATRLERARIRDVVIQRDCAFVSDLLHKSEASEKTLERLKIGITIYTYLFKHRMLFRFSSFRGVVWKKMCEIEKECYERLARINSIENQDVFKKHRTIRKYIYKLVKIMNKLHMVLRTY